MMLSRIAMLQPSSALPTGGRNTSNSIHTISTSGRARAAAAPARSAAVSASASPAATDPPATLSQQPRDVAAAAVGQLALQSSSAARLVRQTHVGTLNMCSLEEVDDGSGTVSSQQQAVSQLPLSQLAFKALLRASLAAARLHHGYVTTPHLLAGLIAASSSSNTATASSSSALAAAAARIATSNSQGGAASLTAAAEAAVVQLIDGRSSSDSAAAASVMLGVSCGLDVVSWVPQLSEPARTALLQAEQLRRQQGHQLLTSNHLLAVLLAPPAASTTPVVAHQMLQQLGFDLTQLSAAASAAVADVTDGARDTSSSSSHSSSVVDDDCVLCEPLGFLHEEFMSSLCAELLLLPGGSRAASAAGVVGDPCLN